MASKLALADKLSLPNSAIRIPTMGFGVYKSPKNVCVASCQAALKAGYRHIDTAQYYANEAQVGEAIRASGVPRKDVFVTSKILSAGASPKASTEKVVKSINLIDKDGYIDLFLIHSPSMGKARMRECWHVLEKLYEEGKIKSIGVSNYDVEAIEAMKEYAKVWPPHVNQIELHPWCQQREVVEYCQKLGIVVEAYSPILRNRKANDATLSSIAEKHGKSTAQVLIRWCLQKGFSPLPKSDTPSRIVENADVYDFELAPEDMYVLDSLDKGPRGAIVMAAYH